MWVVHVCKKSHLGSHIGVVQDETSSRMRNSCVSISNSWSRTISSFYYGSEYDFYYTLFLLHFGRLPTEKHNGPDLLCDPCTHLLWWGISVNLEFLGVIRVYQSHISCNDGLYIIECFLMYLIPMPSNFLSLQEFGDFGMTPLSYQWGEWDKHVTALHTKISVVLDHAKEPTEVFDSSWWC